MELNYSWMKSNLYYLIYVLRHKWFVAVECVRYGIRYRIPILFWRAIIHDWHKFTPSEWKPYRLSFYGPWGYNNRHVAVVQAFDYAWNLHQKRGPHHWQYWVMFTDSQGGSNPKALPIPFSFLLEMVADWIGAGKAINSQTPNDGIERDSKLEPEVVSWYRVQRDRILMHESSRLQLEVIIGYTWQSN